MPDMRFAPPNPLRIADRASGLNAVSVRSYNERLVLSLLLQSKDITRLEIGERTEEDRLAFVEKHYRVSDLAHKIKIVRDDNGSEMHIPLKTQHEVAEQIGHDWIDHSSRLVVENALRLSS